MTEAEHGYATPLQHDPNRRRTKSKKSQGSRYGHEHCHIYLLVHSCPQQSANIRETLHTMSLCLYTVKVISRMRLMISSNTYVYALALKWAHKIRKSHCDDALIGFLLYQLLYPLRAAPGSFVYSVDSPLRLSCTDSLLKSLHKLLYYSCLNCCLFIRTLPRMAQRQKASDFPPSFSTGALFMPWY